MTSEIDPARPRGRGELLLAKILRDPERTRAAVRLLIVVFAGVLAMLLLVTGALIALSVILGGNAVVSLVGSAVGACGGVAASSGLRRRRR